MLTVIWHLLFNGELFVEEGFSKKSSEKSGLVQSKQGNDKDDSSGLSLDEVVGVLGRALKVVSDVDADDYAAG